LYVKGHNRVLKTNTLVEQQDDISELINTIRSGKAGRDKVLTQLYHDQSVRHQLRATLIKYGGDAADFDHILNTTLMQFVKTVMKKRDLTINSSLTSYLCAIAKYIWFHEIKKNSLHQTEDIESQFDLTDNNSPEKLLLKQGKISALHALLNILGKNCREVLLHWANGFSMKEIADIMNYKSDMMARKKKYKCFKELMDYLKENPEIKNALT